MTKEDTAAQESTIMAEWKAFSLTSAYRDWVKSMGDTMELLQNNVDNMTEALPGGGMSNLSAEKAALLNQRKVGIKYALQYPKLRIDA